MGPTGLVSTPGAAVPEFPGDRKGTVSSTVVSWDHNPSSPLTPFGVQFSELPQTVTALSLPPFLSPRLFFPAPRILYHTPGPHLPLGCLGKRSLAEPAERTHASLAQVKRRPQNPALGARRDLPRGLHLEKWGGRSLKMPSSSPRSLRQGLRLRHEVRKGRG